MKDYTYKKPESLSRFLVILLVLGALINTIAAFSSYLQYELLVSFREGAEITSQMADANDNRQGVIGLIQSILFVVTAVIFGKWIFRISSNAHSFSSLSQRHSPRWAVGYYFMPFVNLWRPYQALRDAYEAFLDSARGKENNIIFPLWWFAWIVSNIFDNMLFKSSMRAEELDELILSSLITIASDSFDVFLNIIAASLIVMVTKACLSHSKRQGSDPDAVSSQQV